MRRQNVTLIAVLLFACSVWQACDSGGSGGSNGGKSIGGGTSATYLAYLDTTADNVSVASIASNGTLTPATGSPYLAGSQPVFMATTPDGKFIYVVNSNSADVTEYAIASDGSLSQPSPPTPAGVGASAIAIDPSERFALVTNQAASTLSAFSITSTTGKLTQSGGPISLRISGPKNIVINGNFVFVASANAIDVLLFNSTTGTFSFSSGSSISPVPSSANIVALYASPLATGRLYALDSNSNSILSFTVSTTGVLTGNPSSATGTQPVAMVSDSQNHFLFVANQASSNISVFAIDSTGALAPAATPLVTAGLAPSSLAYDSTNNLLFVGDSGTKHVQAFSVNTSTGALTASGLVFAPTNSPDKMVVAKP